MIATAWGAKPQIGTALNRSHPLAQNLVWFAPCWEGQGQNIVDVVGGYNIVTTGAPAWSPSATPVVGSGLAITTSSQHASVTAPAALRLQIPVTLILGVRWVGATTGSQLFGIYTASSVGVPFGITIQGATATGTRGVVGTGATFTTTSTLTPTFNIDYVVVLTVSSTVFTYILYPVGSGTILSATGTAPTAPFTYQSTAQIAFAPTGGTSQSTISYFGMIFNTALPAFYAQSIAQNPWQLFAPPLPFWWHATNAGPTFQPWIYGDQIQEMSG